MIRPKLKWKTDLTKPVLIENFLERGWVEADEDDENWNIYWADVNTVRKIFNGKTFLKLGDHQIINHFPNYYELTRKDYMVKNLKKYKKQLVRDNKNLNIDFLDFIPLTFVLPGK